MSIAVGLERTWPEPPGALEPLKEREISEPASDPVVESPRKTAVFVLPMATPAPGVPVAAWATTGGWARGTEKVLGSAWVVSDSGVMAPVEASARVAGEGRASVAGRRRWRARLPEAPITLGKDLRKAWRGRRRRLGQSGGPWEHDEVVFVWQRHELFRRDGIMLAARLQVPFVLSVHALQVEEAAGWGVTRPGWSRATERFGELPQLRAADLVACVSDGVAEAVSRRGIPDGRILVTPNGVDTDHFRPQPDRAAVRRSLGLTDRFVVGWSGSFRSFHGLETALEAMATLDRDRSGITLLLIGDGQLRATLEARVRELGLGSAVVFAGSVPYARMPSYLSACDAGLVLGPPTGHFHYSPVKLREYMACDLPVIAHAVGDLRTVLSDRHDSLLIPPNQPGALGQAMTELSNDDQLRLRLAARGREQTHTHWSWPARAERLLAHLPS